MQMQPGADFALTQTRRLLMLSLNGRRRGPRTQRREKDVGNVANRSEPQFFSIYEMGWERGRGPEIISGLNVRFVSRDPDSGASTYMAQLPPGWRVDEAADEATIEVFVLEGDLSANGQQVGAGGFVAIPKNCGPCELSSETGAQVYLWWTPIWPSGYYYNSEYPHREGLAGAVGRQ